MNTSKWDDAEEYVAGGDWIEMKEIGMDFLIAYQAPTGKLACAPIPRDRRPGVNGGFLIDSDREAEDSENDSFFAAAGIPPAPHSFRWFVRRPRGMTDKEFFDLMYSAIYDNWPDDNRPNHHLLPLERAYADLYSDDE